VSRYASRGPAFDETGLNPFSVRLQGLRDQGQERTLVTLAGSPKKNVHLNGIDLIHCASNNYLDLAGHPALAEAAAKAARDGGTGAGGARLLGGTSTWHTELETKLAGYRPLGKALLFNTGFMANLGLIQALSQVLNPVFSDHANHASVMDGLMTLDRNNNSFHRYRHRDMNHLEDLLRSHAGGSGSHPSAENSLVVSETLFSMDGDLAPLDDLFALQDKYGFWLLLDEAHSTLCLPDLLEPRLPGRERLLVMGTFGKAFGGFGAYVCGPEDAIAFLVNTCRPFLFSTALPPPVLAAAAQALQVAADEPWRVLALAKNAQHLRQGLRRQGFNLGASASGNGNGNAKESQSHIVPVIIGSSEAAGKWSLSLREQGFHAPAIRPPTVPQGKSRLRLSLTSAFTSEEIDRLIAALVVARESNSDGKRDSEITT
jgi:glycine C-acetyltransferase